MFRSFVRTSVVALGILSLNLSTLSAQPGERPDRGGPGHPGMSRNGGGSDRQMGQHPGQGGGMQEQGNAGSRFNRGNRGGSDRNGQKPPSSNDEGMGHGQSGPGGQDGEQGNRQRPPMGHNLVLSVHGVALGSEQVELFGLSLARILAKNDEEPNQDESFKGQNQRRRPNRPNRPGNRNAETGSADAGAVTSDSRPPRPELEVKFGGMAHVAGQAYILKNVQVEYSKEDGSGDEQPIESKDGSANRPMKPRKIEAITADLALAPKPEAQNEQGNEGENAKPTKPQDPESLETIGTLTAKISPKVAAKMGEKEILAPVFDGTAKLNEKGEWRLLGRVSAGQPPKAIGHGGNERPGSDGQRPEQGNEGGSSDEEGGAPGSIQEGF